MYTITNCNVVFETDVKKRNVVIDGGKIVEITERDIPADLDGERKFLSAGLVDIHTHGGYGADFMDGLSAFDDVMRFHLEHGTTSVVATSVTAPVSALKRFLENCRTYRKNEQKYATLLGAHLEGPYLSLRNKGAQKEDYILTPETDDYTFIEENADIVRSVTISPELKGAAEMTARLRAKGILVSGGHDDGVYPQFMPAIRAGLSHLTHIYCAMSELRFVDGVRGVGLREYGLTDGSLTAEMIADNKHIPPELARLIYQCKGADKLCVVSDSLRPAGLPKDGKLYRLGQADDETAQLIKVADGVATLADGSRFAGSVTPLSKMVKNLIDAGIPIVDAFRMATKTPAEIIGEQEIGEIAVGKKADLCLFDGEFSLAQVFKRGEPVK